MSEKDAERSFGELPTLGHEEPEQPEAPAWGGPSWSESGLSEAETLKPPERAEGIVDDGRTDAARRWMPGETILDRYVVERELGQGGMGVVYGCLDTVGGVRVAVKCLPPELSHDSGEMEEVRENFRLVYGLSHPNIAGVRQLEKDGKGEYYLVMEVAEGESLRKWLRGKWRDGGVGVAEAVPILRQVAAALDYAHGKRVVHRDVKPGNVMIDGKGDVKVLDFGLADQIRSSLSRTSRVHRGTSGTGPYMSPEQWRGQPQDGKTDQYALGVMAYEMLAGRLPFGSSDLGVLREVVLKEEAPSIPGVPEGAMGAIRRALAKRAEERFGSCGEFVDVLEGKRVPEREGREVSGNRQAVRPGQNSAVGTAGGEDVFLRKVRLEKALEMARRENATPEEKAGLEQMREVYAAGEEALKVGDQASAARLFGQCEAKLEAWRKGMEERLERERAAEIARQEEIRRKEEERKARERAEEAARREAEKRAAEERRAEELRLEKLRQERKRQQEEERKARERAAEEARKEAERKRAEAEAVRREEKRKRAEAEAARWEEERRLAEAKAARERKVLLSSTGVVALVLLLLWGARALWKDYQKKAPERQAAKALAQLKAEIPAINKELRAKETRKAGETKTIALKPGNATMDLVWCPPGAFMMGAPEDDPAVHRLRHRVTLTEGFWMAKTEVTQAQWESVMGAANHPSQFKGTNRPVEYVSWDDCVEFCRRAGNGLRLPTEAEWEYACRAGSTGAYGGTGKWKTMGWFRENSGGQTHEVGKKKPNAWGLYDMHGNVSEWCADKYGQYEEGAVTNPVGASDWSSRVLRGGNWGWDGEARGYSSSYGRFWGFSGCNQYGFRPCTSAELP